MKAGSALPLANGTALASDGVESGGVESRRVLSVHNARFFIRGIRVNSWANFEKGCAHE